MGKMMYWVSKQWKHYRKPLLSDYARVGYLLSPNLTIQEHAKNNPDSEDRRECKRLLKKLRVPSHITSNEEPTYMEAHVIDTFYTELSIFHHCQGAFNRDHIWMMADSRCIPLAQEVLTYGDQGTRTTCVSSLVSQHRVKLQPEALETGQEAQEGKIMQAWNC